MARQQDIIAGIRMGDIAVSLVCTGTSYSPDIADDLVRRTLDLWNGALSELDDLDMLDNAEVEDEDEEFPVPPRELQDPRVVRFLEGLGEEFE
jgi:hypothetical protein